MQEEEWKRAQKTLPSPNTVPYEAMEVAIQTSIDRAEGDLALFCTVIRCTAHNPNQTRR